MAMIGKSTKYEGENMHRPYGSWILFLALATVSLAAVGRAALGEYGDVVINEYSDEAGMRPVVFPHWFHRIRYRCKVCHTDLGFEMKAGGNHIDMLKIIDGQFCGACHNGSIAWSIENCELCHSGKPETPTQVHHSTAQKLIESSRESTAAQDGEADGGADPSATAGTGEEQ